MDFFDNPGDFMSLTSIMLLLLLNTHRTLQGATDDDGEEKCGNQLASVGEHLELAALDMDVVTVAALHNFRIWNTFALLDEDLGYWVKPRSTTWFSRFLLNQYDDERWLKMFRMTKLAVLSLANLLKPTLEKKNTKYRLAIPVLVRLACALFKLTHGASLLICSEMFAVGRSTVSMVLREVVQAINVVLRSEISWPSADNLLARETAFRELCGLPGVVGAIDGTHIAISKPKNGSGDYFYFKLGGFSMNCQAVVDSNKRFLDLFVGMPGSTNDSRVLRRSTLYHKTMQNSLWDSRISFSGFTPYLLGDAGYPLMPWLMVPHRRVGNLAVADELFNRKLSRGRGVVENAFAFLKQSFWELQVKSELNVTFLPDVITCCAILHNVLLRQSHEDVERLLEVLHCEGFPDEVVNKEPPPAVGHDTIDDNAAAELGIEKRRDLGVFLALHRIVPF